MKCVRVFFLTLLGLLSLKQVDGLNRRCFGCRSRSDLGTCGDPFPFNVTDSEAVVGIHRVACPSGWCGKIIEGNTGAFKTDDYAVATERMCLQRPPSDEEERCAYTMWKHRKVYMCFCDGDLCNSSLRISTFPSMVFITLLVTLFQYYGDM